MEPALLALWIVLIGTVTGFLATWLGVGGCFLRIPLMMMLLGLSIKEVYAVNMAVIALATIPGVIAHYRMKHVYKKGRYFGTVDAYLQVALRAFLEY
ncbi:sulfite exporter TauE/SafE family protein [Candidatus Bathyarchaeota archaeon]|nr:sulfite exporter TauE/SafE family protein [Candidatus Bathyarchaeota archaeon]